MFELLSFCLSVRWQKMALLVLRRVGLCVGQNQMCHLCGGNKIELKKCAVGKIKNTEGSAMSVGSVDVQLKYGLYVGHLSKWFVFDLMFKFWSVSRLVNGCPTIGYNSFIPLLFSGLSRQLGWLGATHYSPRIPSPIKTLSNSGLHINSEKG